MRPNLTFELKDIILNPAGFTRVYGENNKFFPHEFEHGAESFQSKILDQLKRQRQKQRGLIKFKAKQQDTGCAIRFSAKDKADFEIQLDCEFCFGDFDFADDWTFRSFEAQGWEFYSKQECQTIHKPMFFDNEVGIDFSKPFKPPWM